MGSYVVIPDVFATTLLPEMFGEENVLAIIDDIGIHANVSQLKLLFFGITQEQITY